MNSTPAKMAATAAKESPHTSVMDFEALDEAEARVNKKEDSLRPNSPDLVTPIRMSDEDSPSSQEGEHSFERSLPVMSTEERQAWGHAQLIAIPGLVEDVDILKKGLATTTEQAKVLAENVGAGDAHVMSQVASLEERLTVTEQMLRVTQALLEELVETTQGTTRRSTNNPWQRTTCHPSSPCQTHIVWMRVGHTEDTTEECEHYKQRTRSAMLEKRKSSKEIIQTLPKSHL